MVFFPSNKKDASKSEDAITTRIAQLRERVRTTDVIKPELDAYIKARHALLMFEHNNADLEKTVAAKQAEFETIRNPPGTVRALGRKMYSPGKYQYFIADQEMNILRKNPKQAEWEELTSAVQQTGSGMHKAYRTWLEETEKMVYVPTGQSTSKESEQARELYRAALKLDNELFIKGDRMASALVASEVAAEARRIEAIFADPFVKEEKAPLVQRAAVVR